MATYLAGKNSSAKFDAVDVKVEAGTINDNIDVDEVTNNFSGGYYEDVPIKKRATVTGLRVVYDADEKPAFNAGDLIDVEITIPGGPSLTGEFRVGSIGIPMLDVNSALRLTFDLTSQGVYVFSMDPPAGP